MTKLFQHQSEGVDFIMNAHRMGSLLWHEMGLGKTVTSLFASRLIRAKQMQLGAKSPKTLVLSPKSVNHQWKKETQKFAPDMFPHMIYSTYSQLDKLLKLPNYFDIRSILLDESHYLKTPVTKRMQDLRELFIAIGNSPGGFQGGQLILMSGTPMMNHAAELYTSWAMMAAPDIFQAADWMVSEERYDKWKRSFTKQEVTSWKTRRGTHYGTDKPKGAANEDKLFELLSPFVHLKKASECLDLPEEMVNFVDLGIADDKLLQDAGIGEEEHYMAVLESLARAKTPYAIDWIDNFMKQSSEQLIVFCPYKFPLYTIKQRWPKKCVVVTGDQLGNERNKNIETFQRGDARIFLTTYKAGGEGINLQCAYWSLYLGYPWSPKLIDQAKARTKRYGQLNRTRHYFLMSGFHDQRILNLLYEKEEAIDSVEEVLSNSNQIPRFGNGLDMFI